MTEEHPSSSSSW